MKIPYVPNPPETTTDEDAAIVSRIQARRAPRDLIPLDLALLHSPPVADGWNSFLGAVRTRTTIGADLRELAISRVAVCNRAWFEWAHHAPLAADAGVSPAALDVVKMDALPAERPAELLSEEQWAVLLYAEEMTRKVEVSEETFALVKGRFNDREVVEITATVAAYNCVSRFLVALNVGEKNGTGPDDVVAH
ncbi:hypothetical protein K4F52_009129 [Lecanicillium sp. MT-2017a]|nr:hypothetical protein K4F52_009129 [Lecanicillium sp. MT-2017a]